MTARNAAAALLEGPSLGEALQRMRTRRGLTQIQVEHCCAEVSYKMVSHYERGRKMPTPEALLFLFEGLRATSAEVDEVCLAAARSYPHRYTWLVTTPEASRWTALRRFARLSCELRYTELRLATERG